SSQSLPAPICEMRHEASAWRAASSQIIRRSPGRKPRPVCVVHHTKTATVTSAARRTRMTARIMVFDTEHGGWALPCARLTGSSYTRDMERLSPKSPWFPFVSVDSRRLGGEPVFRNTRVPIRVLFEYLEGRYTLEEFLDDFPGVTRKQIEAVLRLAGETV